MASMILSSEEKHYILTGVEDEIIDAIAKIYLVKIIVGFQ